MAKATKNVRLITDEIKASGILNANGIEEGVILLECDGSEVNLSQYLEGFNGADVEISIKKKLENIL